MTDLEEYLLTLPQGGYKLYKEKRRDWSRLSSRLFSYAFQGLGGLLIGSFLFFLLQSDLSQWVFFHSGLWNVGFGVLIYIYEVRE